MMKLLTDEKTVSADKLRGFVSISALEHAQQVRVETSNLIKFLEIVKVLAENDHETLILTVEENNPIIIGSSTAGYALSIIKEK